MIDFTPVREYQQTIQELGQAVTKADLAAATDALAADIQARIADATDADLVFVPVDPAANDEFAASSTEVALAWTLGHVIVHLTASSEEAAFIAAELARGVAREGRSRFETPWTSVTTIAAARARLEESRRMIQALLTAWPDEPNLTVTISGATGPRNAVARFLGGLNHADQHREQVSEIVRQGRPRRLTALRPGRDLPRRRPERAAFLLRHQRTTGDVSRHQVLPPGSPPASSSSTHPGAATADG